MSAATTFDLDALRRAVAGRSLVGQGTLEVHDQVGSTSDRVTELAAQGAAEGTLVVAMRQDRGRGRLSRVWSSPPGGLYASFLLRPDEQVLRRLPVTLLAGLAVSQAIEDTCGVKSDLKWPNDVLVGPLKVAGILGDLTRERGRYALVLGVGVNVSSAREHLPDTATTLAEHGDPPTLEALLGAFAARFEDHYEAVRRGGGARVLSVASARMAILGKRVTVRLADRVLTGTASGLNATGALVLELEGGGRQVVVTGEVEELRTV